MCVAANKRAKQPFLLAVVSDDPADDAADANGAGSRTECLSTASAAAATTVSDTALTPFAVPAGSPEAAAGSNSWRRLPWRRWGARCGGPSVWSTFPTNQTSPCTTDMDTDTDALNLIYLTADSPNVLEAINPGDVLVLGGVVDHKEKPGVALDRAAAAATAGLHDVSASCSCASAPSRSLTSALHRPITFAARRTSNLNPKL